MAYKMKGHELPGPNQRQSPLNSTGSTARKSLGRGLKGVATGLMLPVGISMSIMKGLKMQLDSSGYPQAPSPQPPKEKEEEKGGSPAKEFGKDGGLFSIGQKRDPKTGKKGCATGDKFCTAAKGAKQDLGLVLGLAAVQSVKFQRDLRDSFKK